MEETKQAKIDYSIKYLVVGDKGRSKKRTIFTATLILLSETTLPFRTSILCISFL